MKKLFFMVLCFVLFIEVKAIEPLKYFNVINKCSVISDKSIVVPVSVTSTNSGNLTTLINKYKIGNIYNEENVVVIEVKNVTDGFKVSVDNLRDEDNFSNVYFYNANELNVDVNANILYFEFVITFNDEVPDTINVLGNEVLISESESVCENINSYKVTSYEKEVIVKEKNIVSYVVIVIMSLIIYILGGLLWRCKKDL